MLYFYIWIFFQIVIESLPLSSSGHLRLLESFVLKKNHLNLKTLGTIDFEHFLHGSMALVIIFFFAKRIWNLILRSKVSWKSILKIVFLGFIADLVTLTLYLVFLFYSKVTIPLWLGFLITGFLLYSLRFCLFEKYEKFDWKKAFIIGFVQGLAFLPGISRLGITVVTGCWLKLRKTKAFDVSMLLFFPITIFGFLRGFFSLYKDGVLINYLTLPIIFVLIVSFIISYLGFLLVYFLNKKGKLWVFSYYLFIIALLSIFNF